ncbi:kinesin-like protein KIF26B isoform X2 [Osmerus eperlanus]|uniref:kinesin-like protein KIF26B isoform X2 n=1 Tax=Osmerus eperlanus TaxID=29151 RepID=UPI002E10AB73
MSSVTRKETARCPTGGNRRYWSAEAPHSKSPRFYTDPLRASAHEDRQSTNRPSPEGAGSNCDLQGGPSQKSNVGPLVSRKGQCLGSSGLSNDSGINANSVSESWNMKKPDRKVICENCTVTLAALKRRATSLSIPNTLSCKESSLSAFLQDHLQAPCGAPESRPVLEQRGCRLCGSQPGQLCQEVIHMVLDRERAKWANLSGAKPSPWSTPTTRTSSTAPPPPPSPHLSTRTHRPSARALKTPNMEMGRWVEEQRQLAATMPMSISCSKDVEGVPIFPYQSMEESCGAQPVSSQSSPKATHTSRVTSSLASSSAMSFLVRAAQKLNLSSRKKSSSSSPASTHPLPHSPPCFWGLLKKSPPPFPTSLLQAPHRVKDSPSAGKVKVVLRMCPSFSPDSSSPPVLRVDPFKRRVIVMDPVAQRSTHTLTHTHAQMLATQAKVLPRTYTFDAAYPLDSAQTEVCEGILSDVIRSVVRGADGCVLCLGDDKEGRTYSMLGSDESRDSLGILPCAIAWLYGLLEHRAGAGAGSSLVVSVSAVEVCGEDETLRDLLSSVASGKVQDSPASDIHLYQDPIYGMQLRNQRVIHSPSAEHAASLLDAAIASRRHGAREMSGDITGVRGSHMFFSLHIGRAPADSSCSRVVGGYSRLTLIDLASRVKRSGTASDGPTALPMSELGNTLLALLSGNKHLHNRDSRLNMLLQESLGNVNCCTTVVAHVSDSPAHLLQSLSTIQTATRIRRAQKKAKHSTSCSPDGRSLSRERRGCRSLSLRAFHSTSEVDIDPPILRLHGDLDDHSSSDQSCDTVIHVNSDGSVQSSQDRTQGLVEFVPIIPSLHQGKTELEDSELATLLQELLSFSRPEVEKKKKKKEQEQEQEVTKQEVLSSQGEGSEPERDCLKCDTFAELQERLGCIDGRETGPSTLSSNEPAVNITTESHKDLSQTETSSEKQSSSLDVSRGEISNEAPASEKVSDVTFPGDSFQREDSGLYDCEEGSAASSSEDQPNPPGPLLHHTQSPHLNASLPPQHHEVHTPISTTTPSSLPLTLEPPGSKESSEGTDWLKPEMRISPAGKSSPLSPSSLFSPTTPFSTSSPFLATSVLLGDILPQLPTEEVREMKATITVTVQQPLDTTGQDELVFTMVEEVTITGGLERGGRGAIVRTRTAQSSAPVQGSTGTRPIRIISNVSADLAADRSFVKAVEPAVDQLAVGDVTPTRPRQRAERRALPSFINPTLSDLTWAGDVELSHAGNPSGSIAGEEPLSGLQQECRKGWSTQTSGAGVDATPERDHRTKTWSMGRGCGDAVCHYDTLENKAPWKTHNSDRTHCRCREPLHSPSIPRRFGNCNIAAENPPGTRLPGYPVTVPTALKAASLPRGCHDVTQPESHAGRGDCHVTKDFRDGMASAFPFSPGATLERHAPKSLSPAGQRRRKDSFPSSPGKKHNNTEHRQRTGSGWGSLADSPLSDQPRPSSLSASPDPRSSAGRVRSPMEESSRLFSAKLEQIASRTSSLGGSSLDVHTLDGGSSTTSVSSKGSHEGESSSLSLAQASRSPRRSPRSSDPSASPAQSPKPGRSQLSAVGKLMMSSPKVRRVSSPSSRNLSFSPRALRQSSNRSTSLSPDAKAPERTPPSSPVAARTWSPRQTQSPRSSSTKSPVHIINGRISEILHLGRDSAPNPASNSASGGMDLDKMAASPSRSPGEELTSHPSALPVPSPYSRVTAPRRPGHLSGHTSDATSVLSGELPPAMGQTSLLYNRNSVVSSGYESMVRDSEATGSSASNRDSLSSDRSCSLISVSARSGRSARRRGNAGSHPRRPSHDASLSLRRSASGPKGRWVDRGIPEAYEIKVYEIDDAEKLQRRGVPGKQGIGSFSAKLKFVEHRQQRISQVRARYHSLRRELELAKHHLMLEPGRWNQEFDLWQTFEVDSLEHLEALEQVTSRLERRLSLCKASVMIVTCFDAASKRRTKKRRRGPPELPGFVGI